MHQDDQDLLITIAYRSLFFKLNKDTNVVVAWNSTFNIMSQGRTFEEADRAIREAVVMFVRDLAKRRIPAQRASGWKRPEEWQAPN